MILLSKIRPLLYTTAKKDNIAMSMLKDKSNHKSIESYIMDAGENVEKKTNLDIARIIAEGMADYLRAYTAPVSYKQRLWESCNNWFTRIVKRLDIPEAISFEDELPRPLIRDIGVDLIKALHDEGGKTKEQLSAELGIGEKTIQTELRALDPSLQERGKQIRPLRLAGQELRPKIEYEDRADENNPGTTRRYFKMKERLHPIALQLNTQEIGTLLYALYKRNEENHSILSREMAIDIWCQLSPYGQTRIEEIYGERSIGFQSFLEDIQDEIEDSRLITFHTEDEQSENNMSRSELLLHALKSDIPHYFVIYRNGQKIILEKARIKIEDLEKDQWKAIPEDKILNNAGAIVFSSQDKFEII